MTTHSSAATTRILIGLVAALGIAAGFWILRNYEPTQDSWFPKCVFFQWTGLHCPGCGATRALRALAHGELLLAIRCNPLLIIGLPIILAAVAIQRHQEQQGRRSMPWLSITLAVLFTLFMVLRNVPSPTRSWLAPPPAATTAAPQSASDQSIE